MSYPVEELKKVSIVYSKETITKEEVPRLLAAISNIIMAASKAYGNFITKDWEGLAVNATNIVRNVMEIKEILET